MVDLSEKIYEQYRDIKKQMGHERLLLEINDLIISKSNVKDDIMENYIIQDNIIELVKKLSNNYNDIIPRSEIRNYPNIDWGDNGLGDRWCGKRFNYTAIYAGRKEPKLYSDNENDIIPEEKLLEFKKNFAKKNSEKGTIGIFVHSLKTKNKQRPIRKDILEQIKKQNCVSCGSNSDIICDHKNDLYNDPRILNTKTQKIDDFQSLCNHCNLQKRQVSKKEKEDEKIYSAKRLEKFKVYEFDFPWEKKAFNMNNITTKLDTYWYDPIEFQRKVYNYSKYYLLVVSQIKKIKIKEI
jgi:hypothetical protein